VELPYLRRSSAARSTGVGLREDFGAQVSIFAPDAVFAASPMGLGVYEGRASGELRMRYAAVGVWANGSMQRGTNYLDNEEARATAERLAAERR
jgi:hypothetical protein